jgi:uncharacterized membrane protein
MEIHGARHTGAVSSQRAQEEDPNRKGYIPLNYFNLFWVFVLCSVIGLIIESVYHVAITGELESRAGLVLGPFSPIYGCGAVLFTIALNRFWNKNVVITFAVSMVLGMALEFATSFLMQNLLGMLAWDYSGTFGNIDGRTNVAFGLTWGLLGVIWIRILLPGVLRLIRLIPYKWRLVATALCSLFMALNIAMTLAALDREFQRSLGIAAANPIERLCDEYFPDEFMSERFSNMTLDPRSAWR